jgi:hypothetical protein
MKVLRLAYYYGHWWRFYDLPIIMVIDEVNALILHKMFGSSLQI